MLKSLPEISYVPSLSIKPAEMLALEELPARDKDLLMPAIHLCPWVGAGHLGSALSRLEQAYGERPCFLVLSEDAPFLGDRPVHLELAALRDSTDGYANWCSFIEQHTNFVPALQILAPRELPRQLSRLYALERGLLVTLGRQAFPAADALSQHLAVTTLGGRDVYFLLDLARVDRDVLSSAGLAADCAKIIKRRLPHVRVIASASSFPNSFEALPYQDIYERVLYNEIQKQDLQELIYGDRGSVRPEQLSGGGIPYPRVDYALDSRWYFFRAEMPQSGLGAYTREAQRAMRSPVWDARLRIWGTQMIERTALGDPAAISGTQRAVATRINIHLHRQLFHGDPIGLYETDDEWTD